MSILKAITVSRAPFLALAVAGLFWGTFAALLPDLKAQSGAGDAAFGFGLVGSGIGGFIAMYMAPRMAEALGRRTLPLLGVSVLLVMQAPMLVNSVMALLVAMTFIGASLSAFDICANMRISQLEDRHRMHLMNVNHAAYSGALGLAALVVSWMRSAGWEIGAVFHALTVPAAIMVLLTWEGRRWLAADDGVAEEGLGALMPWGVVIVSGGILFVSFLGELSTETWSALYIERELGGEIGAGSLGPFAFGMAMAAVRIVGQFVAERLGEERVLLWSGVTGGVGLMLLASAPSVAFAIVGIGVTAMGLAVIVPTTNSLLGRLVPTRLRATAISRAWLIGFMGYFAGPFVTGYISEMLGLRIAFAAMGVLVFWVVPSVLYLRRKRAADRLG